MPSLRGLKLGTYLLFAPAGAGFAAYQLSDKYKVLQNFDEVFFLVKATQELYDSGIPKVPKGVQEAVEGILKHKERVIAEIRKGKGSQAQAASASLPEDLSDQIPQQVSTSSQETESKPEIFGNGGKKYWCRYFDYSGGKDNVIMQYDPYCTLYNVFDHKASEPAKKVSSEQSTTQKNVVINVSDLVSKTSSLKTKELKSNSEFKKGGFYLLKLDKNRIPQVNSSFSIEITAPGNGDRYSERVYQSKITTVKIQAPLSGSPEEEVNFKYSSMPSSRLIVKKVKNENGMAQVESKPEEASEQDGEATSYYFKNSNNNSDPLYVEEAWSFGKDSTAQTTGASGGNKFDLSLIDEEPLKGFGSKPQVQETTSAAEGDKYYLFKNLSDFWKYKVGDRIDLYKLTSKDSKRKKRELQQSGDDSNQGTKLATFEVVSGAIYHSSVSPRCVTKEQKGKSEIKPNLRKRLSLIDIAQDKQDFCRYQKDIPEHVLFLIGYNENTNKATS